MARQSQRGAERGRDCPAEESAMTETPEQQRPDAAAEAVGEGSAPATTTPEAVEQQDGGAGSRRTLKGIPEIRNFFRTSTEPIYFLGATAFNLLGLDRWVRNFHYIAYYD